MNHGVIIVEGFSYFLFVLLVGNEVDEIACQGLLSEVHCHVVGYDGLVGAKVFHLVRNNLIWELTLDAPIYIFLAFNIILGKFWPYDLVGIVF